MRSIVSAVLAIGVVLGVSVSFAEENSPRRMPEKVRAFLDGCVGTWRLDTEPFEVTVTFEWDRGKNFLIGRAEGHRGSEPYSDAAFWHWDGVSEDGVTIYWVAPDTHTVTQCRVLSKTLLVGEETGIQAGKTFKNTFQVERDGPGRSIITNTKTTLGGERQPDWTGVSTRVTSTSDEQELIRLQHEWTRAINERDPVALGRLLVDDFVQTTADGTRITKARMIEGELSEDSGITNVSVDKPAVQIYGNTALVMARAAWSEPGGKRTQAVFTDTWLKRDGRWQCLTTHESGVQEILAAGHELSPEMKKLAVFVGQWVYEGEQTDPPIAGLPFGPAGKFSGTITTRFILDGSFQESRIEDKNPGGMIHTVEITGYDGEAQTYATNAFMSDGTRQRSAETLSFDRRIRTSNSTVTTTSGRQVLLRSTTEYSPDWVSYASTTEASADNGQTWARWYSGQGKKVMK